MPILRLILLTLCLAVTGCSLFFTNPEITVKDVHLTALDGGGVTVDDQRVHVLRLVAHGVEDRILAVIAPDEEVLGVIEPAGEHVCVERQHFLVQLGAPSGARDFVDCAFDADLGEALSKLTQAFLDLQAILK